MNDQYPCYTGMGLACTQSPYEDLADALTTLLEDKDHAFHALTLIGRHATAMSNTRLLSNLLTAYGNGLTNTANSMCSQPIQGSHARTTS